MSFDWTHSSYEFVDGTEIHRNISFKDNNDTTTDIMNSNGKRIATVWTASGDINSMPEYQGVRYVRAVANPLLDSMTDEALANYFRITDKQLVNAYNELRRRGYTIDSDNDFDIDVSPISRIYKTVTTEQEI